MVSKSDMSSGLGLNDIGTIPSEFNIHIIAHSSLVLTGPLSQPDGRVGPQQIIGQEENKLNHQAQFELTVIHLSRC